MKRFFQLILIICVCAGCQELEVTFTDKTPEIRTGYVSAITGTSAELSASFSKIDIYDAGVICCYISVDKDFNQISHQYMIDVHEYPYLDSGEITVSFTDLLPNQIYYYKFGILHGEFYNGSIHYVSSSEVWGETESFKTDPILPRIMNIVYNDYYYTYIKDVKSEVVYDLTIELDSPISGYVDSDCSEYGVYIAANDASFERYISDITLLDSGKSLRFKLTFDKKDYRISYINNLWYAGTSKCRLSLYAKKNYNRYFFAEITDYVFEYTHQPSLSIVDLQQGKTETGNFGDGEHNWDRSAKYGYKLRLKGTLFYNSLRNYYYGNWVSPGKGDLYTYYYDGELSCSGHGVRYSSTSSSGTDYIFYVAEVNDTDIISDNSIRMYYDGKGNVSITTSSYLPSIYNTKATTIPDLEFKDKVGVQKIWEQ